MVIVYKFSQKVCENCGAEKACTKRGRSHIIKAGDSSPAIRQKRRTNTLAKAGRKEQMKEILLFGKYQILKLLANGSGGEVFLAEHKGLGERRVIKRLWKNRPFYKERLKEAHTLKLLRHTAIPVIYDIEEDKDASYIIEEDMGGETLSEFLLRQKCLPTSSISHYSIQLCEVIEYLHQNGVLYLDVKPENLLICGEKLSLIDFGGAVRKSVGARLLFGTDGFAAPEQYKGEAEERTDIYGIGCVIKEMADAGNQKGKELRRIYERCMQKNPRRRYPEISSLKADLQRLCGVPRKKQRKENKKSPRFIGVSNVQEGADGAAFCALLAGYFSEREKGRIAYIDLSGQGMVPKLYENLFGSRKEQPAKFTFRGVCYMTGASALTTGTCTAQEFAVWILHFGTRTEQYRNEFFRCDSRFAIGSLYPWQLQDWEALAKRLSGMTLRHAVTAVITGGEKELLPISMKKVIELSLLRDVLYADRNAERMLKKLF